MAKLTVFNAINAWIVAVTLSHTSDLISKKFGLSTPHKNRRVQQLSLEYQCSERTIRRHLEKALKAEQKALPQTANIVMDTTRFKQRFAVLVLMDSSSSKPIYFRFIPAEKNRYYFEAIAELMEKGVKIQSITCDGRRDLLKDLWGTPT